MNLMKRALLAFAMCGMVGTTNGTAGWFSEGIYVRTMNWQPGCNIEESAIEVYNTYSEYAFKVLVEAEYRNGTGPGTCTLQDSTSWDCAKTIFREIELGPCGAYQVDCDFWGERMPVQCWGVPNCDNASCDSGSHCSSYPDLRVRVTAFNWRDGGWISIDPYDDICLRGAYGSSPGCPADSICSDPNMTGYCSFDYPFSCNTDSYGPSWCPPGHYCLAR